MMTSLSLYMLYMHFYAVGAMLGCINFWFIVVGLLPCFWYLIIREKELAPRCSAAAAASWQCLMSLVTPFSTGIP